jgi:hypothetical protein
MAEQRIDLRPVQVFLDTQKFIETPEPVQRPVAKKDFFKGNDEGFMEHKARMTTALTSAATSLKRAKMPGGVVRVKQRPDALAKSHRPMVALFSEAHGFSLVGTESAGELLFQATPSGLERLARIVEEKAERTPKTVINKRTNEPEIKVSAHRSELGGIDDMRLHSAQDKVRFSAKEAVEWMGQENVIGGYIVELFRPNWAASRELIEDLVASFNAGLDELKGGMIVRPFLPADRTAAYGEPPLALTVQLTKRDDRLVALPFHADGSPAEISEASLPDVFRDRRIDLDVNRHQALLTFLTEQSLVRSVDLPPVLETTPSSAGHVLGNAAVPAPAERVGYPVVGIIDGGVSSAAVLSLWKSGDAGLVPAGDRDEQHGTFIAGLVSGASSLNPLLAARMEGTGCKYFDLDLFPRQDLRASYYRDIEELFDVLDEKIKVAKRDHGVRVFNLSFKLGTRTSRFAYSLPADRLDRIARANDVIFVVAAGNAKYTRPPWPEKPADLTAMLAAYGSGDQQLSSPGEHVLGLTVGALNPAGIPGHPEALPTTYTCRGPGVGGSHKPELSNFGGAEVQGSRMTGLISVTPTGRAAHSSGTSYAAPLTASMLATLDHRLAQQAARETLLALAVHRATRAPALNHGSIRHISREFVGFGMAPPADAILRDEPNSISLVFNDKLLAKQVLEFPFVWPQSLVGPDGSCRGQADVTLCFTPPIDPQHRDESIRVQLEAQLSQESIDKETGEVTWPGRLAPESGAPKNEGSRSEQALIRNGLKWSPVKRYRIAMPKGRGASSNWVISLVSLLRAGEVFPTGGVPFSLIVTISDPDGTGRVGEEIRQSLQGRGLVLADITVAHRVRPRRR